MASIISSIRGGKKQSIETVPQQSFIRQKLSITIINRFKELN